ncbi:hypothetical protein [Aquimarina algiphila]|uniref:TonB-dependent receptor plug domain-containing protein n=1 Tax=Aquimarina algiphila TaxID=2047982 RepID=A0A554VEH9_9FLAO|nr:hypothetical protein [Aquimarina algiphila]TSE05414.1 hypothetical protein FOF46_22890 [Aquimarina algiphila]
MKKWIILGMGILGTLSLTAFTTSINQHTKLYKTQSDEITAIINKDTSEQELEDLKTFFSENGIELIIKEIQFNDQNEITSLSLILKKGNSKSQYSSSSNEPISKIELGYKDDSLFITNSGMFDIAAWRNQSGFSQSHMDMDSIMKKHNFAFDFNFDEENDSLFFNGSFDIQKLKDQIMQSFSFEEGEDGSFIFNGQQLHPFQNKNTQKFSFVDNPDIEKLIIIDGKESDFDTLDHLAKSDQLSEVDFLKSQTAISIYGDKAKDGAIIAITKK